MLGFGINIYFTLASDVHRPVVPQGTVHVQLCSDFNALPDEECMEELGQSCDVVAVESPAYFRAYQPVLEALKGLDLERIFFLYAGMAAAL